MLRIVIIVLVFGRSSSALKCWTCDGKRSIKECHDQFGRMQECNPGDVCQNDFRTANGETIITKGCKQRTACETEVKQNKDKNQCGSKLFRGNMACRCCCSTTGCNRKRSGCLPPPPPCRKSQIKVRNSRLFCSDIDIRFGTKCKFICNPGFELKGPPSATCKKIRGKQGRWDVRALPKCKQSFVRCFPARTAIKNGVLRCYNTKEFARFEQFNYLGAECLYRCKRNYYLAGKKVSTCKDDGKWSNPPPSCKRGSCKIGKPDSNRINNCTAGYKFGSRCVFSCAPGYQLVGEEKSNCRQVADSSRGSWTNGIPRCKQIKCSLLQNPRNGKVSCSEGRLLDSTCIFSCNPGYDLDGTSRNTLESTCGYVGKELKAVDWFPNPSFTCSRIRCVPPRDNPFNGVTMCSNRNWLGSVCKLSCNDGFFFDADESETTSLQTQCEDDGNGDMFGQWSLAEIDCKPVVCDAGVLSAENTLISCSNSNFKGSECIVACIDGFALKGDITRNMTRIVTRCDYSSSGSILASWTKTDFICVPITCSLLAPIDYGSMECSHDARVPLNGKCEFECDLGYRISGSSTTWCRDLKVDGDEVGEWTDSPPECILDPCETPVFDESRVTQKCVSPIENDEVDFRLDTECSYQCKTEGLYMVNDATNDVIIEGDMTVTCLPSKQWTDVTPRCDSKICDPLPTPRDGYAPQCTSGREYLSECTFVCHEKYEITQPKPLVCISREHNSPRGVWSQEVPECMRSHCDDFGIVKHGRLDCTNGSRIGSVCKLSCKDRYIVKHYEDTTCLDTIQWSHRQYFCCVRCDFNRKIRVVAAFDTSAFSTKLDWEYMVDLTESYLTLLVQNGFDIEFSAFLYGKEVQRKNIYKMTKLTNRESISVAAEHLEYMCNLKCLREDEGNTAQALKYVDKQVFGEWDQEREHFIIIRTTGKSRDNSIKVAGELRAKNINILAIGIKNRKDAERRLRNIAGKERNYLAVARPRDLKDIPAKIVEISRDTGCTEASKSKSCP